METSRKQKILSVLLIAFIITVLLRTFVVETFVVRGDSMYPTIKDGDHVFINKIAYSFNEPNRGDIVVAFSRQDHIRIVKRIIGMPGDRVEISDGKVVIRATRNDPKIPLEEAYLNGPDITTGTTTRNIDPQEYFAMGDNRQVSIDSRELGPVDLWDLQGKVFLVINLKTLSFKAF